LFFRERRGRTQPPPPPRRRPANTKSNVKTSRLGGWVTGFIQPELASPSKPGTPNRLHAFPREAGPAGSKSARPARRPFALPPPWRGKPEGTGLPLPAIRKSRRGCGPAQLEQPSSSYGGGRRAREGRAGWARQEAFLRAHLRSKAGHGRPREDTAQRAGEEDDDIEEGDLPEHKRQSAPIDFSKIDPGKPESLLKMTKKGKTLMMFVTVSGEPTEKETEEITNLWQGSLFNANYDVQRFIVGSNRAIFMLRDGSYAWEVKDFLVNQERCEDVTLEGQVYPGKGGGAKEKNKLKPEKPSKKKDTGVKPGTVKDSNRASRGKEEL
uniref:LRP chaperone MESD n=1 Tax=Naja naja TaxID=35670 RepID=A0A8C6X467_NAJNA